jgi:hypothetical protein
MHYGILITHYIVVTLFLVIYFVKTILLISNKQDALVKLTKTLRVPEMIISVLFLGTGIYLLTQLPEIKMLMIIKLGLVFLSIPLAIIGFKKGNKILASLSFFMLVASFGIAEVHHKRMGKSEKSEVSASENFNAQQYYSDNCSKCHGADGKAGLAGAKDLSTSALDHGSVIQVIREGKGAMAGYPVSEEQADQLATFVESLRTK